MNGMHMYQNAVAHRHAPQMGKSKIASIAAQAKMHQMSETFQQLDALGLRVDALVSENAALREQLERQQAKEQIAKFDLQERLQKAVSQQRTVLEAQPEIMKQENARKMNKIRKETDAEIAKEVASREAEVAFRTHPLHTVQDWIHHPRSRIDLV